MIHNDICLRFKTFEVLFSLFLGEQCHVKTIPFASSFWQAGSGGDREEVATHAALGLTVICSLVPGSSLLIYSI